MAATTARMGRPVDIMPVARPVVTVRAGPDWLLWAMSLT